MRLLGVDFGFARIKEENATMTRCGTPCWTAPEIPSASPSCSSEASTSARSIDAAASVPDSTPSPT